MLTEDQRTEIEARLKEEREDAVDALRRFDEDRSQSLREEAGEMSVYRFHMADIGTESMEREKSFLLASKEGERLYQIDQALRRLYRDPETFGTCTQCGGEIGMERLRVIPETDRCAACADRAERQMRAGEQPQGGPGGR